MLSKSNTSANKCNRFYIHQMEVPYMTAFAHCANKLRNRKVGKYFLSLILGGAPCDRCFSEESFGRCSPLMFCDECRPHVGGWDQQVLAVMVHYFKQELNFVTRTVLAEVHLYRALVMSQNQALYIIYIISCSGDVQPSYSSLMRLVRQFQNTFQPYNGEKPTKNE